MENNYKCVKTKLGYFEVEPKPTEQELYKFYSQKYFQQADGQHSASYSLVYSDEDKAYFEIASRLCIATARKYNFSFNRILDIGCGEGFFSKYFHKLQSEIILTDLSSFGLESQNPDLIDYFVKGDAVTILDKQSFKPIDLINFSNVLEHVADPEKFICSVKNHMHSNTVIRCAVPNDYSKFQNYLLANNMTTNTWFTPPQHLSYFNVDTIEAFFNSFGLKIFSKQVGFPIELFLANKHSNYVSDRSKGSEAHKARILSSIYCADTDISAYQEYSEAAAKLDFGRDLIVFAKLNQ